MLRSLTYKVPALVFAVLLCACANNASKESDSAETDSLISTDAPIDNYDIAMAVSSITDAIELGEPLDSAEYNFEGILTDGQGTPLYTDVQGSPGKWQINVVDERSVKIRNLYLGDLVPDSLTHYIIGSLKQAGSQPVLCKNDNEEDDSGCIMSEYPTVIYKLGKSTILFQTKSVYTSSGDEGPLFCITIE